ncbi:hypothetical protein ACN1T8_003831 [Vibrio cholerae]|uniref:Uncharacterized protein n=1 Tax=Vibrio cholerae TaxID=666 RepID=A0A7Z7YDC7_VIBCL|nr:hypothetical protein [Vibrio cholerae]EGQ9107553.1 hypothetical protein [Vibrio cholerae]MBY4642225.1 hypothetical protein [Vibrio cholerae]MCR9658497.1 hypothetical protein [Vibrio cholerae]MCR9689178.1 hypothetical protein [Vibrio cholerae]MCR9746510.1 hypothetical protein [Vibrio cholerae]
MNKYDELLKANGFVLISDKGVASSGFDFNYDHEHFDGCRMGSLAPLLFAQTKLNEIIQSKLIDFNSSDVSECYTPLMPSKDNEAEQLGECFAEMLCAQIPYAFGSQDHFDFIKGLCRELNIYFHRVPRIAKE